MATGLAKAGARVAIWGRNEEKNQRALNELRLIQPHSEAFKCDVTKPDQVDSVFQETVERLGKVDSCFANAGAAGRAAPFHKLSVTDWQSAVELNVLSVVSTFRAATRHYRDFQKPGKLIATSSIAAKVGLQGGTTYCTTKSAITGLIQALSIELGKYDIQANAILPGYIPTEVSEAGSDAFRAACERRSASGRLGEAKDLEELAVYLASPGSNLLTGQSIVIDGGYTLHPL